MDKKKLLRDLILFGACLFVSLALWATVTLLKKDGAYCIVTVNGKEIGRFSLTEYREEIIETENGTNILIINEGFADITEATCPDGLCVRQRRTSRTGESLVCLPNKVTVTVVGAEEGVDIAG